MTVLSSHKHPNKINSIVVLIYFLISSFSANSATTANASRDLLFQPPKESLASCVPAITFTKVPVFGSLTNTFLEGRVECLPSNVGDYKVAIYIYPSGWWIKPTFADPLTSITPDINDPNSGVWRANIRTGGIDELATQIAAFVLPANTNPQASWLLLANSQTLSDELYVNSNNIYLKQDRYRTIEFSGLTWNVKSSEGLTDPGPNRFSASENDVWVDGGGNLHLTIRNKNSLWYSTEVFTQTPLSYGTYTFTTASPIDHLDKNAVLGLFTWDGTDPASHYREMDIEFSKWGEDTGMNSQYVVQPFDYPGNRHRFDTILTGVYSSHSFKWEIGQVNFSSHQGHAPTLGDEVQNWTFNGPDVPTFGLVNVRINLWLYDSNNDNVGDPPSDGQEIEVVIESFSYKTRFNDVPSNYWAFSHVERLANAGITGGCALSLYCPEDSVTRAQMAVFLEKGIHYPATFAPSDVTPTFTDTISHWAEDWIEALKSDGITSGCGANIYCPENPVTRAQMAIFLLKAKHGSSYSPPAATGIFTDVPVGYWADKWIEQLAAEGITSGCAAGLYCPDNSVTRAQMAVFLVKAFGLP